MIGDILIKLMKERPRPLLSLLAKVQEDNVELAKIRLESGQAAYIIRSRPTRPTRPTERREATYVV